MREATVINDNYKGKQISLVALKGIEDHQDLHTYFKQKAMTPSQKHELLAKEFMEAHDGFNPELVLAFGSSDVTSQFADKYIEKSLVNPTHVKRNVFEDNKYAYRCNANTHQVSDGNSGTVTRWKAYWIGNLIIHEDARSAWNCALAHINNPEYSAIIVTSE